MQAMIEAAYELGLSGKGNVCPYPLHGLLGTAWRQGHKEFVQMRTGWEGKACRYVPTKRER